MSDFFAQNKGFVIGMIALGLFLVGGSYAASAHGMGVDRPPAEEQRGQSVRHGGHFFIFYTGGFGRGARGVNGRGVRGGGPGMGK